MGRAVLAALLALLLGAPSAGAATYIVNRTDDPAPDSDCGFRDPCSFREAVIAANDRVGLDVIVVRPGNYTLDPPLAEDVLGDEHGDLDIRGSVRIFGSGRRSTWISGCAGDRGIEIHGGAVEIRDFRIAHCSALENGGGVATVEGETGSLQLIDVRLDHNRAAGAGGNLYVASGFTVNLIRSFIDAGSAGEGGGVYATGPLSVRSSKLRDGRASDRGGNVFAGASLDVTRSSIEGGSAIGHGGNLAVTGGSAHVISRSTLSGGRATGIDSWGGQIFADAATLRIENVTLARGWAGGSGGGLAARRGSRISLASATVAYHRAGRGGGLGRGGGIFSSRSSLLVRDTLVFRNTSDRGADDCWGRVRSLGHNLARRCGGFKRPSDIRTARARLGRFALHGAETKTISLRRNSPAVDAGSRRCPPRDQRNRSRRRDCDIGAFEFQGPAPRRGRR